jgi:hypothetical protein
MTQDEVIQPARDSGMELYGLGKNRARFVFHLEAFAKLVAEKEREACAKVCEDMRPSKPEYDQRFYDGCTFSAAAIRQRGQA